VIPEILIVGDPRDRVSLAERIERLGYDVGACAPAEVSERLAGGAAPSAVVVCTADADPARVMSELRASPQGAAVPVTLYGRLDGDIRDLADVLDLGADHFLEEPVGDDLLVAALEALAGPPVRSVASTPESGDAHADEGTGSFTSWPSRTEIIDEPEGAGGRSRPADGSGPGQAGDMVIGQLHRTLDMLDERLRGRQASGGGEERDDVDLASLGLDAIPHVEADAGEVLDPAESQDRMQMHDMRAEARPLARAVTAKLHASAVMREQARIGPREGTVLLENARPASSEVTQTKPAPPWRALDEVDDPASAEVVGSGMRGYGGDEDLPPPTLRDRPRRAAPLPVDRRGSLAVIEVPRLVWKLHRGAFSGRVNLVRGRIEKRIWFDAGTIVFARSNLGHDRLIDGLLRRGLLTRAEYETARRLAAKEPRRAGALLVEAGFLKQGELHRVLREHLMRIVDSTFPWNEGNWSLEPNATCSETVLLDVSTALVVAEGIRSRMEAPQLWGLLGGPRQHPRLRAEALAQAGGASALANELRMSPSEEAWLELLDGKRNLQQLTEGSDEDELELLALVYLLHVLDLVDLVGEAEPEPMAAQDPVEVDRRRIEDRLRVARESDYFELLGLPRDANRLEVRRAHAELLRTFSDDHLEPETRRTSSSDLAELRAALDEARLVLVDDALRIAYLAHLEDE
jgi:CheY-like chemotaxis protein